MKTKQRFLKRKAQVVTLKSATDSQVFAELMKRVIDKTYGKHQICYFVDPLSFTDYTEWEIHAAGSTSLLTTK